MKYYKLYKKRKKNSKQIYILLLYWVLNILLNLINVYYDFKYIFIS